MMRLLGKPIAIALLMVLVAGPLLEGCSLVTRVNIENADQAREYILAELKKKYGEEFAMDGDIRIVGVNVEKGYISEYCADRTYPVSSPSEVFLACCKPYGNMQDNRAQYFFVDRAREFVDKVFEHQGIDYFADWEVSIGMPVTTRTWKRSDSFERFMDSGPFNVQLVVWLYLKPDLTDNDYAEQIFECQMAIRATRYSYEIRACPLGDDILRYPLYMYNSEANTYTPTLESVRRNIESFRLFRPDPAY